MLLREDSASLHTDGAPASQSELISGKRASEVLVLALLVLKLAISAWNAVFTHGLTYDRENHIFRATHSPLTLGKYSYDPPLYYVPAYLYKLLFPDANGERLMLVMRLENLVILAVGYACWIYVIIPRLIGGWRQRTAASLVLLTIPAFQKIAQATHPDNLHFGLASAAFALWLVLWRDTTTKNPEPAERQWLTRLVGLSILIGTAGMTRPFAAATVATFCGATLVLIWVRWGKFNLRLVRDAVLVTAIAGALSTSWFVYRKVETGLIRPTYDESYVGKYRKAREGFDFPRFFSTFYFRDLLREPNRSIVSLDKDAKDHFHNKYGNSFATLAYSELWGDHWCYFNGQAVPRAVWAREEKKWPKRIIFSLGLPLTAFLFFRGFYSIGRTIKSTIADWRTYFPSLVLIGYFLLGAALYLWWQTGEGLTPGKNSSVKALYNAHLLAPLVIIPLLAPQGRRSATVLAAWAAMLVLVSVPLVLFWPSW